MNISRFLSEPFTASMQQGQIHPPQPVTAPLGLHSPAHGHSEAIHREPNAEPWAHRSHGPATFKAIALWLRCTFANSARAWALAAGVPPDLFIPDGPGSRRLSAREPG